MNPFRIFIVDDDADFAESLAQILEGRNCEISIAPTGEEAIETFRTQDFDLAFMDVKLPGKNGVESFLEIRKLKPLARVVMMTGFSVEQLIEEAVENGAYAVLHKPLNPEDIIHLLECLEPQGILIVDDDPSFVSSVQDYLETQHRRIFTAHSGPEALDHASQNDIDILILDLQMPILDGLETYIKLKQIGCVVPTIIVTAHAESEAEKLHTLSQESAGLILRKPFDPRELIQAIQHLSKSLKEASHE